MDATKLFSGKLEPIRFRIINWIYRIESRIESRKQSMLLHTRIHHTFQSKQAIITTRYQFGFKSSNDRFTKFHVALCILIGIKGSTFHLWWWWKLRLKDDILLCDKTDSSVTNKVPRTLLELWLPHWNSAPCSPSIPCYELELTSNLVYCWQTAMIDNLFKFWSENIDIRANVQNES